MDLTPFLSFSLNGQGIVGIAQDFDLGFDIVIAVTIRRNLQHQSVKVIALLPPGSDDSLSSPHKLPRISFVESPVAILSVS